MKKKKNHPKTKQQKNQAQNQHTKKSQNKNPHPIPKTNNHTNLKALYQTGKRTTLFPCLPTPQE